MSEDSTFVKGMKLTPSEIAVLDRYVNLIEQADKNPLEFVASNRVAFTPVAMLVIALAKFAYDVYQDYGKVAISPEELQMHFKSIAKKLADLESGGEESLSLDTYARLRRELVGAKSAK